MTPIIAYGYMNVANPAYDDRDTLMESRKMEKRRITSNRILAPHNINEGAYRGGTLVSCIAWGTSLCYMNVAKEGWRRRAPPARYSSPKCFITHNLPIGNVCDDEFPVDQKTPRTGSEPAGVTAPTEQEWIHEQCKPGSPTDHSLDI